MILEDGRFFEEPGILFTKTNLTVLNMLSRCSEFENKQQQESNGWTIVGG